MTIETGHSLPFHKSLSQSSIFEGSFYNVSTGLWRLLYKEKNIDLLQINFREYRREIKNEQSKETDNIGYTRQKDKLKTQHNTRMFWTPLCTNKHI
jgi:hypothetical protein